MKSNKITSFLLAFFLLAGFSSCLKESNTIMDTGNGNTLNLLEFKNTGNNLAAQSSKYPRFDQDLGSVEPGGSAEMNVNVSYSGIGVAPEDITVTLATDPAALDLFNQQNGTHYEMPPASVVELPTSVVIKKGTRETQTKLVISVSPDYAFDKAYAVPLKIASSSPSKVISGNFGTAIYSFAARNAYDGIYSFEEPSSIIRNSATGADPALSGSTVGKPDRALVTLGANRLSLTPIWANGGGVGGIDGTFIEINPDNTVTMMSSNATLKNTVGKSNYYDPATKTFHLAFDWGVEPNTRVVEMTLKYKGPR